MIDASVLENIRKVLLENRIPPAYINGRPFFVIEHSKGKYIIPTHGEIPKELQPYEWEFSR